MSTSASHVSYFSDLILQAVWALKDNRLRAMLSVMGIAIGITAVMVVGTISKGGREAVFAELQTFGLRSIWVMRDRRVKDPIRVVREGTGVDEGDYQAIRSGCCPAVSRATPIVSARNSTQLVHAAGNYSDAAVHGVGEDYLAINNDVIRTGRWLGRDDIPRRRNVAVIGPDAQSDLFGAYQDPLGKEFRIGAYKFTVIGVLNEKSRDFLSSIGSSGGGNANNRILIPFTVYQEILGTRDEISWIQAEATDLSEAGIAVGQLLSMLKRRHQGRYDYKAETMAQYIATAERILGGVSIVGVIAASVSLLVGGMGIMNIMSTSVLERTREIGLRKAIGAKRRDILAQFLMEAVLISGIGGLMGLMLGIVASVLLAVLANFPLILSFWGIVVAIVVSIAVGLLSGYYPAYRAAIMQPVVALRYE